MHQCGGKDHVLRHEMQRTWTERCRRSQRPPQCEPGLPAASPSNRVAAVARSSLVTVDHYVRVKSTAPAFAGRDALIYVREVALAGAASRSDPAPGGVVLFVHGAGTPAEVTFDVPHKDYSWMAYLAKAGFDVFSMDMTGYGRSTRPPAMNDPCNFSKAQQAQFVPNLIPAPCAPSHPSPITTMDS